jgi:hypothetical protein
MYIFRTVYVTRIQYRIRPVYSSSRIARESHCSRMAIAIEKFVESRSRNCRFFGEKILNFFSIAVENILEQFLEQFDQSKSEITEQSLIDCMFCVR